MTTSPVDTLTAEPTYSGGPGPYAGADTEDLVHVLEREHEQGRPFTAGIVFELAGRALAADELMGRPPVLGSAAH